jgi:hypothetical protein
MRAASAILVLLIGCKPMAEEELVAETTGECEDPESSSSAATELPACLYDLAYGPCRDICQGYDVDGVGCPSFGGGGWGYSVCAFECEIVDDCPPTPDGRPAICDLGGCFIDCADSDCPEGSSCVQFGFDPEPTAAWVCMVGAD